MFYLISRCTRLPGIMPPDALARLLTDAIAPGTCVATPALPGVRFIRCPLGGHFTTSPSITTWLRGRGQTSSAVFGVRYRSVRSCRRGVLCRHPCCSCEGSR